jgi:putative transposase
VTTGAAGVYDPGGHVVGCPRYRRPVVAGPVRRLGGLLRETSVEQDWPVVAVEIEPDQVHLCVRTHPKHSPSCVAHQVTGFTSRASRDEVGHLRFRPATVWSRWYVLVAMVGAVSAETVPMPRVRCRGSMLL